MENWFSVFSIFVFKIKANCLVLLQDFFENDFGLVQNIVDLLVQIILNLEEDKASRFSSFSTKIWNENLTSQSLTVCAIPI